MWECTDNQEVGLEAAILERVRNSSLVKCSCADDVTGLKHGAEAADPSHDSALAGGRPGPGRRIGEGVPTRVKAAGNPAVDAWEVRMPA